MALQKQTITLDFGFGGLDQKSDARRAQPVKFSSLVDVRFSKLGRIETRRAYEAFASGITVIRLFSDGKQLSGVSTPVNDFPRLYRFSSSGTAYSQSYTSGNPMRPQDVMPIGEVVATKIGQTQPITTETAYAAWARADSENYFAVAYWSSTSTTGTSYVEIYDKETRALCNSTTIQGSAPHVLSHPDGRDEFVVGYSVYLSSTTGRVEFGVITPSSTLVALSGLPTETTTYNHCWDAAVRTSTVHSTSAVIVVAYNKGNGIKLRNAAWPGTGGSGSAISSTTYTGFSYTVSGLNVANFADPTGSADFRVTWTAESISNVQSWKWNDNLTIVSAVGTFTHGNFPARVGAVVLGDDDQTAHIWVSQASSTATITVYQANASNTIASVGSASYRVGTMLTKPMAFPLVDSSVTANVSYLWGGMVLGSQSTAFLLSCRPFITGGTASSRVMARALHLESWGTAAHNAASSLNYNRTTKELIACLPRLNRSGTSIEADAAAGDWGFNEVIVRPFSGYNMSAKGDGEILVTGGYSTAINASDCPLPTAPLHPPVITANAVTTGGSLTEGSYAVSGYFEFVDNQGKVRRSETATPITVALSGTQSAFSVSVLFYGAIDGFDTLSSPSFPVRFVATRTLVNESQVYYRELSYPIAVPSGAINFNDSDALVAAREPMYTAGGVYDDSAASCPIAIASNGRRTMVVEGDNPNFVMQSKPERAGYGTAFMDGVGKQISGGGDRIYALAAYMDRWFAFKRDAIFVATGDGADLRGQNDSMSEFEAITTGLGCTSPRSVLVTSVGIVFLSDRGFYLIGPDLTPRYIGADVEDFTSLAKVNNKTLLDACYDPIGASTQDNGARDAGDNTTSRTGTSGERCVFVFGDTTSVDTDTLVLTILSASSGVDLRWSKDSKISANTGQRVVAAIQKYNGGRLVAGMDNGAGGFIRIESDEDSSEEYCTAVDTPALEAITSWMPMGGIQGFGRIYKSSIIGAVPTSSNTSTTVTVAVGYDYSPNFSETHTIQVGAMQNGEFEFGHQRTRCEAVRYRITQTSETASPGFMPAQIQVTVGVKGTTNKLPASARARKS